MLKVCVSSQRPKANTLTTSPRFLKVSHRPQTSAQRLRRVQTDLPVPTTWRRGFQLRTSRSPGGRSLWAVKPESRVQTPGRPHSHPKLVSSTHHGSPGPAPPSAPALRALPAAAPLAALVTVGVCEFPAAPVLPRTQPRGRSTRARRRHVGRSSHADAGRRLRQ